MVFPCTKPTQPCDSSKFGGRGTEAAQDLPRDLALAVAASQPQTGAPPGTRRRAPRAEARWGRGARALRSAGRFPVVAQLSSYCVPAPSCVPGCKGSEIPGRVHSSWGRWGGHGGPRVHIHALGRWDEGWRWQGRTGVLRHSALSLGAEWPWASRPCLRPTCATPPDRVVGLKEKMYPSPQRQPG